MSLRLTQRKLKSEIGIISSQKEKVGQRALPAIFYFIHFWLHRLFIAVCRLSLVAVSGGYSLVAMQGLLIAVAALAAGHGLLSA